MRDIVNIVIKIYLPSYCDLVSHPRSATNFHSDDGSLEIYHVGYGNHSLFSFNSTKVSYKNVKNNLQNTIIHQIAKSRQV